MQLNSETKPRFGEQNLYCPENPEKNTYLRIEFCAKRAFFVFVERSGT